MGRKALDKTRRPLSEKAKAWMRDLLPKLQDKQLDKLTLDQIALLSGRSKSTIYTYFNSKEEIYLTAIQMVLTDLKASIYTEIPKNFSMEESYREILLKISKGISGLSIQFLGEIQTYFPKVWMEVEQFTDQLLLTFRAIYKRGMQSGEFHFFNVELLMAMDSHFVMSIMTDSKRFKHNNITLNDLVVEYLELRIKALK
jgi:AcrR family transcriptional regulator